jgi:hypothetical protein
VSKPGKRWVGNQRRQLRVEGEEVQTKPGSRSPDPLPSFFSSFPFFHPLLLLLPMPFPHPSLGHRTQSTTSRPYTAREKRKNRSASRRDKGRILLAPVVDVPLHRVRTAELLAAERAAVARRLRRVLGLVVPFPVVRARESLVALVARVAFCARRGRSWVATMRVRVRGGRGGRPMEARVAERGGERNNLG